MKMANFEGLMALTLDQVIRHTGVHHSSTSTYKPNFMQIGKLFVDVHTHVSTQRRTDIESPFNIIRSTLSKSIKTHLYSVVCCKQIRGSQWQR